MATVTVDSGIHPREFHPPRTFRWTLSATARVGLWLSFPLHVLFHSFSFYYVTLNYKSGCRDLIAVLVACILFFFVFRFKNVKAPLPVRGVRCAKSDHLCSNCGKRLWQRSFSSAVYARSRTTGSRIVCTRTARWVSDVRTFGGALGSTLPTCEHLFVGRWENEVLALFIREKQAWCPQDSYGCSRKCRRFATRHSNTIAPETPRSWRRRLPKRARVSACLNRDLQRMFLAETFALVRFSEE